MFVGTFEHYIDAKGRIILPRAFRQAFSQPFIISAGFDRSLNLWRRADWESFVEREITKRTELSREARLLNRWLHSSAHTVSADSQNRFLVPPPLREQAQLEREIVLTGAGNRVEIWPQEGWRQYIAKASGSIEEIAESLARELRI